MGDKPANRPPIVMDTLDDSTAAAAAVTVQVADAEEEKESSDSSLSIGILENEPQSDTPIKS